MIIQAKVERYLAVGAREARRALACVGVHLVCACSVVEAGLTGAVVYVCLASSASEAELALALEVFRAVGER